MTPPCAAPVSFDRLVDYWAGDLDTADSERIEEHLFGCDACAAEAARVARIAEAFRAAIPAVIDAGDISKLRARGLVVEENPVAPGTRREAAFPSGADLLIHRLQGLDLARAERVHVAVRVESTGDVIAEDPFAPFDRQRGEVLIACQRHFAHLPPDIAFDVRAHDPSGQVSLVTFPVPHVFPAAQ